MEVWRGCIPSRWQYEELLIDTNTGVGFYCFWRSTIGVAALFTGVGAVGGGGSGSPRPGRHPAQEGSTIGGVALFTRVGAVGGGGRGSPCLVAIARSRGRRQHDLTKRRRRRQGKKSVPLLISVYLGVIMGPDFGWWKGFVEGKIWRGCANYSNFWREFF